MFSTIKQKFTTAKNPVQSYELVDQNPSSSVDPENVVLTGEFERRSRSSSVLSDLNKVSAVIDDFTMRDSKFNKIDLEFIHTKFLGFKKFSRKAIIAIFGSGLIIWVIGLLLYSGTSVPADGETKGDLLNLDMDVYRRGILRPSFKNLQFIEYNVNNDQEDDGRYIVREGSGYHVFKLSDNNFHYDIIPSLNFDYDGNTFRISDFIPSFDLSRGIVVTDIESQWRHSTFAHYWIYDANDQSFEPIKLNGNFEKLSFAKFSPLQEKIVIGFQNNLYIKDLRDGETKQLTFDGSNEIFNGKPDWVYEEEVLAEDTSFWISPNEENIVFLQTDESSVSVYELQYITKGGQYPSKKEIKYPKPGTSNPKVKLINYNFINDEFYEISHDQSALGDDYIVYGCHWIDDNDLIIKETDRVSNLLNVRYFSSATKESKVIRSVDATESYNGWHEKLNQLIVIPNDNGINGYVDFVVIDGFDHLVYFETPTSENYRVLTTGTWDVIGEAKYIKQLGKIYFQSTSYSPMGKNLQSVSLNDLNIELLTPDEDSYYDVNFSPGGKFLSLINRGPEIPTEKIIPTTEIENTVSNERISFIKNFEPIDPQEKLLEQLSKYSLPTKKYHEIKIDEYSNGDPVKLNVLEIKPPNFDSNRKYPLLIHAYGGPGSQTVKFQFDIDFQTIISSSLDAVVLIIDPRGTSGKGWRFKSFGNLNLGKWEPRDIKKLTQWYVESNPFINKERTAIWGWSYGGFTTLKTLEFDQGETIKYGMAVAPVTDWMYYDSIYTERYMNLPQKNENYENAKVNIFGNFKHSKRFLIMHGTADDNVHFQNTLHLLDEFDLNGVENYDVHIFPDSDHSIYHNNANKIVYDKLVHWLDDAFNGKFDTLL